jgi:hypothetical protein
MLGWNSGKRTKIGVQIDHSEENLPDCYDHRAGSFSYRGGNFRDSLNRIQAHGCGFINYYAICFPVDPYTYMPISCRDPMWSGRLGPFGGGFRSPVEGHLQRRVLEGRGLPRPPAQQPGRFRGTLRLK